MIEIGSRRRRQPAPPHVVFEALTELDRDPARPWLVLLDDERRPQIIEAAAPSRVVWSSLWLARPDAVIDFDLARTEDGGTDLRWTLRVAAPAPDESLTGHLRHRLNRLNRLLNSGLRRTFGQ